MSKYNRNRRLGRKALNSAKRARSRIWYMNVGDGALRTKNKDNPNDRLTR